MIKIDDILVSNPNLTEGTGAGALIGNDINSNIASGDYSIALGKDTTVVGSCSLAGGMSTPSATYTILSIEPAQISSDTVVFTLDEPIDEYSKVILLDDKYYQTYSMEGDTITVFLGPEAQTYLDKDYSGGDYTLTIYYGGSYKNNAFSFGLDASTLGDYSAAFGWKTLASGEGSFAAGINSIATNNCSTALGNRVEAYGQASLAAGYNNKAYGNYNIALGSDLTVNGLSAVALGDSNEASGRGAIAVGYTSSASEEGAFAACKGTASGKNACAVNQGIAAGEGSFAAGASAYATGKYSVAFGQYGRTDAIASGDTSFVVNGRATKANSVAIGKGTLASSNEQIVLGTYNIEDTNGDYSFILGNGTTTSARKNALTIAKDSGDATFSGNVLAANTIIEQKNFETTFTGDYTNTNVYAQVASSTFAGTYRKWADGTAEIWGHAQVGGAAADGIDGKPNASNVRLPIPIKVNCVNAQINIDGAIGTDANSWAVNKIMVANSDTSTLSDLQRITCYSESGRDLGEGQSYRICLEVKGMWK